VVGSVNGSVGLFCWSMYGSVNRWLCG